MGSRIVIGGRVLGTGKYGGSPKCLCGSPVEILGRCAACHDALRRRRLGLPPNNAAEKKRLDAYLEQHEADSGKCPACGRLVSEDHTQQCAYRED